MEADGMDRVLRLRRYLDQAAVAPAWPAGFFCRTLLPGDAPAVHGLLQLAYTQGRGVPDYSSWWVALSEDSEFDPALCFLAVDGRDRICGVAQCWTGSFLKDLAVHPDFRRRGLGEGLLRQVFWTFRQRGARHLDLKVEAGNASAIRLYESVGMRQVPLAG
jgi:ribosomal protein S18 acetylase RimI-like enzyme